MRERDRERDREIDQGRERERERERGRRVGNGEALLHSPLRAHVQGEEKEVCVRREMYLGERKRERVYRFLFFSFFIDFNFEKNSPKISKIQKINRNFILQ